jgi:hypothetical protein
MIAALRLQLGRRLFRLGLRLMGDRPDATVYFARDEWAPADLAAWAVAAYRAVSPGPGGTVIAVPEAAKDFLDAAVAAPPPAAAGAAVPPGLVSRPLTFAERADMREVLASARARTWLTLPDQTAPADLGRRVRLVAVPADHVLDWFASAAAGYPRYVTLPLFRGLPDGARVQRVRENFYTKQFEFVVEHASFDPVPEGVAPPLFPGPLGATCVAVELPDAPLEDGGRAADSYKLNPGGHRA